MKLQVNVHEARGLAAKAADGAADAYVNLQLGRTSSSTNVVYKSLNPCWNEEFSFRVDDLEAEVLITVWDKDCFSDAFLGRIKQSVFKVLNAENRTLSPAWYPLQQRKSKGFVTGEVLLSFSLYGSSGSPAPALAPLKTEPPRLSNDSSDLSLPSSPSSPSSSTTSLKQKKSPSRLGQKVAALFSKGKKVHPSANSNDLDHSPMLTSDEGEATETEEEGEVFLSFFGEESTPFLTSDEGLPAPLPGGVLLEQTYATTMKELNAIIFRPGSTFLRDLHTLQKTTDLVEDPWTKTGNQAPKRVLTYVKAATKLVKAVKATEEQTYLRADDKGFVVLASVSTPDVPCGTSFRTEVQFCMTPVILDSAQEHCHLRVSWRMNFLQNIMIKGVVESGARQGLKENYQQFAEVLSKYARPVTNEDSIKAAPEEPAKSDWELFTDYIRNPVVIATFGLLFFMLLHMFLADSGPRTGLEFWELQLPDSLSEFFTAAFLTLQLQRIWTIASKFLRARVGGAGDHGIKAKGEGWLLTVTLVEGENLPLPDDSACLDPYVVFACSGKTRTSSVKLQTTNPKWTEIFEFDATADPPSTLELEVFNYDGPFPEAESLGSAEINFLKHTSKDLADIWVTLNGRRAQSCGSRLHLRIFLTNTKETDVFVDYVKKVEKEVGSKIVKISAQRNSSFQKLFSLPPEEFLINDFACAIKRKIPLQGRLFMSPRMLGFYSNIFGHKTKFSILWEDIEEVQELPPTLANVGPSVVVFTRLGRAHDADQGAKSVDAKGRLKFQFQSFVRPGPAFRTLSVLWKNKTLSPEEQVKMVRDVEAHHKLSDCESQTDDSAGDFLGFEDPKMTQVYHREMPFTTRSIHMLYTKENLEYKIMEKMGCGNYAVSPWGNLIGRPSVQQRQVSYKFNRRLCQFGSAVSGVQQKEEKENGNNIVLDCLLRLHDVPFGDNFQIQVRKDIRTLSLKPPRSSCTVFVGMAWQKGTPLQNRITSNVFQQFTKHLQEELALTVKEIMSYKNHHAYILV